MTIHPELNQQYTMTIEQDGKPSESRPIDSDGLGHLFYQLKGAGYTAEKLMQLLTDLEEGRPMVIYPQDEKPISQTITVERKMH